MMKLIYHFYIILFFLFLSSNSFHSSKKFSASNQICFKAMQEEKNSSIYSTSIMNIIEILFDEPRRFMLTPENKIFDDEKEKEVEEEKLKDGIVIYIPRSKYNQYENLKFGIDDSAYLYDFLDPLIQFEISWEFFSIYNKTLNLPYIPEEDPYSYEKLEINELYDTLHKIKTNGKEKWENYVTVPQIKIAIDKWRWIINTKRLNKAKYFVDKYDFNGDGRLNLREFLLGMIIENRNNLDGYYSCKNCMEDVINNKIDIIFKYISYNRFEYITAEDIWEAFRHLKRGSNSNFYSLYTCQYYKNIRTFSVNDFILKSQKSHMGQINLKEFRLGILLGYWNRQIANSKIFFSDEMNQKFERWTDDGLDIKCEEYKNRHNKG
jgi:hypothetical protein